MSSGKITYSLDFLPANGFREIVKLNSEGFGAAIETTAASVSVTILLFN